MGSDTRFEYPDLMGDFLENSSKYEFFQALRMLEEGWPGRGRIGNGLDSSVRMRPAAELGFPASDIRRCAIDATGRLDLQLNFMGLYGVDAPVPLYFSEAVARCDEAGDTLRAFLDVFCHRLYAQFYMAWKKYRPYVDLERNESPYVSYLQALSGQVLTGSEGAELGFSGALGARVRGAAGLEGMVSEFLGNVCVEVEQYVPRWVEVEQDATLGGEGEAALGLGDNTVLGEKVLDVSGKVNVRVGPVDLRFARELLPGNRRAAELGSMISRYLDPTVSFDLIVVVNPSAAQELQLGVDEMALGWSSWLGSDLADRYELRVPGRGLLAAEAGESIEEHPDPLAMVA